VCAKDVSLGTYLCLHFTEFDWAVRHGVPASLVLISIELEDAGWFHKVFADPLKVAEDVHRA